jgi:hypothetical protein
MYEGGVRVSDPTLFVAISGAWLGLAIVLGALVNVLCRPARQRSISSGSRWEPAANPSSSTE